MLDFSKYGMAERAFRFFSQLSEIPHGSSNTERIAEYLFNFAKERGLYAKRDGANNVIIRKCATRGYEDRPTVILQGHSDMVAEKTPDSKRDLLTEGLSLYIDGDFLRARETTLGGDDGIALAYALAILDSDDIEHPEIEAVFTSDEEIGLLGAAALDCSELRGKILINIDSDEEGIFTVGCAGGVRADITLPLKRETLSHPVYSIGISGLLGGHSGIEIDKGRANAIKLLGEALVRLGDAARLVSMRGGNMDNAIPRDASAVICSPLSEKEISELLSELREENLGAEPEMCVGVVREEGLFSALTEESHKALVSIIAENPSGVIAMSRDIPGLVETSLNLGIVRVSRERAEITYSFRSSLEAAKDALVSSVRAVAKRYGADFETRGAYPAWEYRQSSHLRDTMCRVYREMYGKDAKVITIHAGLECGIFSNKIEGLDCVSIGPDNFDIHTTEEHLSLSSSARVFDFLLKLLCEI